MRRPARSRADECCRRHGVRRADGLGYVWRHLPLNDVHPDAQMAAEFSEAAAARGAFWEMHHLLLEHSGELRPDDLDALTEAVRSARNRATVAAQPGGA